MSTTGESTQLLSRRRFVKTAARGMGAAAFLGAPWIHLNARSNEVDVVVVGSGVKVNPG